MTRLHNLSLVSGEEEGAAYKVLSVCAGARRECLGWVSTEIELPALLRSTYRHSPSFCFLESSYSIPTQKEWMLNISFKIKRSSFFPKLLNPWPENLPMENQSRRLVSEPSPLVPSSQSSPGETWEYGTYTLYIGTVLIENIFKENW